MQMESHLNLLDDAAGTVTDTDVADADVGTVTDADVAVENVGTVTNADVADADVGTVTNADVQQQWLAFWKLADPAIRFELFFSSVTDSDRASDLFRLESLVHAVLCETNRLGIYLLLWDSPSGDRILRVAFSPQIHGVVPSLLHSIPDLSNHIAISAFEVESDRSRQYTTIPKASMDKLVDNAKKMESHTGVKVLFYTSDPNRISHTYPAKDPLLDSVAKTVTEWLTNGSRGPLMTLQLLIERRDLVSAMLLFSRYTDGSLQRLGPLRRGFGAKDTSKQRGLKNHKRTNKFGTVKSFMSAKWCQLLGRTRARLMQWFIEWEKLENPAFELTAIFSAPGNISVFLTCFTTCSFFHFYFLHNGGWGSPFFPDTTLNPQVPFDSSSDGVTFWGGVSVLNSLSPTPF